MTPEQIPTALDTAIALGVVAVLVSLAALRLGYARALIEWLGYKPEAKPAESGKNQKEEQDANI